MFYDIIYYPPVLTPVHRPSSFDILLPLFIIYKLLLGMNEIIFTKEEFEDIKGVIIINSSRTDNTMAKRKKYKMTNIDLQNIHIKLKIA